MSKNPISLILDLAGSPQQWRWQIMHRTAANFPIAGGVPLPATVDPVALAQAAAEALADPQPRIVDRLADVLGAALIPSSFASILDDASGGSLLFRVPRVWADIPFELCRSLDSYLGVRFAVGTIINDAEHTAPSTPHRYDQSALFVAATDGTPAAEGECRTLAPLFRARGLSVRTATNPDPDRLLSLLPHPLIAHLAGHASPEKGLQLPGGNILSSSIEKLHQAPLLVFLNACHTGSISSSGVAGMAGAFLLAGSRMVIGPATAVRDADAARCAQLFHTAILSTKDPHPPAEALRRIRAQAHETASTTPLLYRFFGDPIAQLQLPAISIPRKKKSARRWFSIAALASGILVTAVSLLIPHHIQERTAADIFQSAARERWRICMDSCDQAGLIPDRESLLDAATDTESVRNRLVVIDSLDHSRFVNVTSSRGYYYERLGTSSNYLMLPLDSLELRALTRLSWFTGPLARRPITFLAKIQHVVVTADGAGIVLEAQAIRVDSTALLERSHDGFAIAGSKKAFRQLKKSALIAQKSTVENRSSSRNAHDAATRFFALASPYPSRVKWDRLIAPHMRSNTAQLDGWWLSLSGTDSGYALASTVSDSVNFKEFCFVPVEGIDTASAVLIRMEKTDGGRWLVQRVFREK